MQLPAVAVRIRNNILEILESIDVLVRAQTALG
jgi:hypothetical protein